jgi:hypothetical protein
LDHSGSFAIIANVSASVISVGFPRRLCPVTASWLVPLVPLGIGGTSVSAFSLGHAQRINIRNALSSCLTVDAETHCKRRVEYSLTESACTDAKMPKCGARCVSK